MKYMKKENITWAVIIPLIGGLPIGVQHATGKFPEYVLSYDLFQHNDQHYINYLREKGWKGKYYVIDESKNNVIPNITTNFKRLKKVNVVCGVPPCAGLSSLSNAASADSAVNDWMINASEYVLSNVKPEVYFFENAPRLATSKGAPVADKLYNIAKSHGYNFLIYSTESRLHGSPQIRPRTYGFFLKKSHFDNKLFKLFNFTKERTNFLDLMNVVESKPDDPMNVLINKNTPTDDPYFVYCMEQSGITDYTEFVKKFAKLEKSQNILELAISMANNDHEILANWMSVHNYEKEVKRCLYRKMKVEDGKGYYTHGLTVARGQTPAFIGVLPHCLAHPTENRFLTLREALTIMDMPQDFNIVGDNPVKYANHICQNVCAFVARDMMHNIIFWLTGENKNSINETFAIQRHRQNDIISKTPDDEKIYESDELFE